MIVVGDMAKAKRLCCDVLGGTLIHEKRVADRKEGIFVAVGNNTVVELARPLSPHGTARGSRTGAGDGSGLREGRTPVWVIGVRVSG